MGISLAFDQRPRNGNVALLFAALACFCTEAKVGSADSPSCTNITKYKKGDDPRIVSGITAEFLAPGASVWASVDLNANPQPSFAHGTKFRFKANAADLDRCDYVCSQVPFDDVPDDIYVKVKWEITSGTFGAYGTVGYNIGIGPVELPSNFFDAGQSGAGQCQATLTVKATPYDDAQPTDDHPCRLVEGAGPPASARTITLKINSPCENAQVTVAGNDFGVVCAGQVVSTLLTAQAQINCLCGDPDVEQSYTWSVVKKEFSATGEDGTWVDVAGNGFTVAGSGDQANYQATFPDPGYWKVHVQANVEWKTEDCSTPCAGMPVQKILTATAVGIDKIVVEFTENEGPYYMCSCPDASLTFKAKPMPQGISFPAGQPTWELKRWEPSQSQWISLDTASGETVALDSPTPGTYRLVATCGTSSDTFDVIVQEKSKVGMLVDSQAVEGGSDNIRINFVRIGGDQSRPLDIKFSATFSSASQNDLENDGGLTRLLAGSIRIEANESMSNSIDLRAVADTDPEGIEYFEIQVSSDCCYDLAPDGGLKVPNTDYQDAFKKAKCMILECKSLYAIGGDDAPQLIDDDHDDIDDNMTGNPGIHISDIKQYGIADCYAMAAMMAVVQECWQLIDNRIIDNLDGTYTVWLWNGNDWDDFIVDDELVRGTDAAELSGDIDSQQCAEIWPIILEKALADMEGNYQNLGDGGEAWLIYNALTGANSEAPESTEGKSDAQILQMIEDALDDGNQVAIGTFDVLDNSVQEATGAHGNHYYVVESVHSGIVELKNPWGDEHISLSSNWLSEVAELISILDDVSCP